MKKILLAGIGFLLLINLIHAETITYGENWEKTDYGNGHYKFVAGVSNLQDEQGNWKPFTDLTSIEYNNFLITFRWQNHYVSYEPFVIREGQKIMLKEIIKLNPSIEHKIISDNNRDYWKWKLKIARIPLSARLKITGFGFDLNSTDLNKENFQFINVNASYDNENKFLNKHQIYFGETLLDLYDLTWHNYSVDLNKDTILISNLDANYWWHGSQLNHWQLEENGWKIEIDPTFTKSIQDSNADAEDSGVSYNTFNYSATSYKLASSAAPKPVQGWMFRNITIPQETTILDANLVFSKWRSCASVPAGCDFNIYGVSKADVNLWKKEGNRPKDANKTNARTYFYTVGNDPANGSYYMQKLSVTAQVQEIINRTDWVSDNNMAFITAEGKTASFFNDWIAYTYDHASNPSPQLVIKYSYTASLDLNWMKPENDYTEHGKDLNTSIEAKIKCLQGNCGDTNAFLQWCENQECSNWKDVNASTGKILLITGNNPVHDSNLTENETMDLNWTIQIKEHATFELKIKAKAKNTEETTSNGTNKTIYANPPTTSIDYNAFWQTTDANIHLNCSDGNESGCNQTHYRIDLNPIKDANYGEWKTYDTNILITQDGNTGIQYYSTDNAGNSEETKTAFILIDKTQHYTLVDENYLPNPSNAVKNYALMQDSNLIIGYCINSGYYLGNAYYTKSSNGINWSQPTKINTTGNYCSGNYSETETPPYRTGEGGISLASNSLNNLFFLFTEWNGTKAWSKILYSNQTWSNTTSINNDTGKSPNKDTLNIVIDSNNSIHYIITQGSGFD